MEAVASVAGEQVHDLSLLCVDLISYPVFQDVLQFKRIVTEEILGLFGIALIELFDTLFQLGNDTDIIVGSGAILPSVP